VTRKLLILRAELCQRQEGLPGDAEDGGGNRGAAGRPQDPFLRKLR